MTSREYRYGQAVLHRVECVRWLRSAPAASFHAVVTDPPFGLVEFEPEEQLKLVRGRGGVWRLPPAYDGYARKAVPRFTELGRHDLQRIEAFMTEWALAVRRVLVPGAHVVVASNPLVSHLVARSIARAGMEKRGEIVRLVQTLRGGDRPRASDEGLADLSTMPRSAWEPWLLFRVPLEGTVEANLRRWGTGALRRCTDERPFTDVIPSSRASPYERMVAPHPSLKPQAFMRQLVRAVLPRGGCVIDPFAGSGATLAAAESLGVASVGIERSSRYFALARRAIPRLSSYATPPVSGDVAVDC